MEWLWQLLTINSKYTVPSHATCCKASLGREVGHGAAKRAEASYWR
jgi:hypothetical protein